MKTITKEHLDEIFERYAIKDINKATLRQIGAMASELEPDLGEPYVHLEIGNPGIPPETIGIEAQCEALHRGVASIYPNIQGIKPLKDNGSRFLKAFLDVDVPARTIIPTVGSMQGCFTLMLLLSQCVPGKDTILFIDPGFAAQHHQAKIVGLNCRTFDNYEYRGEKLREKLDELLADGRVIAMIYSNPNNPAWTNLTDEELRIIGEAADKHDVIILEDLAYLGMDFRTDTSRPFEPPYIPSVAKYTDNYILLTSGSKIFSYAGERIALMCISPKVFDRKYPALVEYYNIPTFGDAYIFGVLYAASSGASHSAQWALSAMLEAAVEGKLDFVDHCREYERRARKSKDIFESHHFNIVYDIDGKEPIADGFFYTIGYNNIEGGELQRELMRYGIAALPLKSTGSEQPGVRVTVSLLSTPDDFRRLDERLKAFDEEHQNCN